MVVSLRDLLVITVIDKYRLAASSDTRFHIPPAIAHHKARSQINIEFSCSSEQHTGAGLPAGTSIVVVVVTHNEAIYRQTVRQIGVNRFNRFPWRRASCHVRLIRDNDQDETSFFQSSQRLNYAGQNLDFGNVRWWVRFAVAHHCTVQYPISIKKNRPPCHRVLRYLTADSHLV